MSQINRLLQDLKHGMRGFARSPSFTVTAVAALALGIGANTAIFSVINPVLLRPLPFPNAERLVFVDFGGSPARFMHHRAQTGTVRQVSAFRFGTMTFTGDRPERVAWGQVSADFFALFGARVVRGRTFGAEEDLPGGPRVAVLGEGFRKRFLGADRDAVGHTISLNGDPYLVIGVVGSDFDSRDLGQTSEVYTPFQLDPNTTEQGEYFQVAGRLDSTATLAQARAQAAASTEQFRRRFPGVLAPQFAFSVYSIQEVVVANGRQSLLLMAGAVALVLLIACANVANLLLARATSRRREIALRAALGAGRGRIVRQLLTESLLLATLGGSLGLGIGILGIRTLLAVSTAGIPRIGVDRSLVRLDWRVLAFTAAISVVTGILFGLLPALSASRTDLNTSLRESGGRAGTAFRQARTQSALVVTEVMLALVLLIGSALLIRTSLALSAVDLGFDARNVLTMTTSLGDPRFQTTTAVDQMIQAAARRLRTIPGVVEATAGCCMPLRGGYVLPVVIVGRPLAEKWHDTGGWFPVGPGYFELFKIPLRRGRTFTARDDGKAPQVAIVNEAMAKRLWPDHDPLRDRIVIGGGVMKEVATETERQIIGIVGDVRNAGPRWEAQPTMYVPSAQISDPMTALIFQLEPATWLVRTKERPAALAREIQSALRVASGLAVADVQTMDAVVSRSTSGFRFHLWLMTIFGTIATALAAIGIYGLTAYSVQQRLPEIGIRMAMGATAAQVQRMVIGQGMRLAVIGLVVGSIIALGLTRLLSAFLFGVQARNPAVFGAVAGVIGTVALLSVWLPARRASAVDPIEALRAN